MVLDATDVVLLVSERHDVALVGDAGHFEAVGQCVCIDHPRVVASHLDALGKPCEEVVVGGDGGRSRHAVIDFGEVGELAAKAFADGLMPEAHTQDGLLAGVGFDDIEQETCLGGDARTWREDDLVERLELLHLELVVAIDGHFGAQGLDEMTQIVGE